MSSDCTTASLPLRPVFRAAEDGTNRGPVHVLPSAAIQRCAAERVAVPRDETGVFVVSPSALQETHL